MSYLCLELGSAPLLNNIAGSSLDLQSVRLPQVVFSSLQPQFSSQVPQGGLLRIIL